MDPVVVTWKGTDKVFKVERYHDRPSAQKALDAEANERSGAVVESESDLLRDVPTFMLLAIVGGGVTKFESRAAGARRALVKLEELARTLPVQQPATPEPITPAAAAGETQPAKEAKVAKAKGKRIDKTLKIKKLVTKNPRREGTTGYKSFEHLRSGMTVEAYLEAGGRMVDLNWDIKHEYVELIKE